MISLSKRLGMETVIELNDDNFNEYVLAEGQYILIDFYSPGCHPCQALLTHLPSIAAYVKDQPVTIAKVNITQNPLIQNKYQVISVPLVLLINNEKKVFQTISGANTPDVYMTAIDKMLKKKNENKGFFSFFN